MPSCSSGTGCRLRLVNTHLHHMIGAEHDQIRAGQADALLTWLAGLPTVDATIVTGDFNADPLEPTYARMIDGGFRSAYREANGAEPDVTWPSGLQAPAMDTDGEPGCLDYIWVSGPDHRAARPGWSSIDRPPTTRRSSPPTTEASWPSSRSAPDAGRAARAIGRGDDAHPPAGASRRLAIGARRTASRRSIAGTQAARSDGLEFDVHLAADGTPVVIHDPTLARVQGVDGTVAMIDPHRPRRASACPSLADVLAARAFDRVPRRRDEGHARTCA